MAAALTAFSLAVAFATAGPASAATAPQEASCSTTGAWGDSYTPDLSGPGQDIAVELTLEDTKADGYSVGIRLVTTRENETTHYWPWHKDAKGNGTAIDDITNASDSGGIFGFGVQVARFSGNTVVNSCIAWS